MAARLGWFGLAGTADVAPAEVRFTPPGSADGALRRPSLIPAVGAIAETAGIKTQALFEAFSKGSADSFALRNHGFKAVAARQFPERTFSTEYMLKDISYALEMAQDGSVDAQEAKLGAKLLQRAVDAGYGAEYWPAIVKVIEPSGK